MFFTLSSLHIVSIFLSSEIFFFFFFFPYGPRFHLKNGSRSKRWDLRENVSVVPFFPPLTPVPPSDFF